MRLRCWLGFHHYRTLNYWLPRRGRWMLVDDCVYCHHKIYNGPGKREARAEERKYHS